MNILKQGHSSDVLIMHRKTNSGRDQVGGTWLPSFTLVFPVLNARNRR